MEKLLKKKAVADAFGVTIKAGDKWVCAKKIPYIKISGKCVRFRPALFRDTWTDGPSNLTCEIP